MKKVISKKQATRQPNAKNNDQTFFYVIILICLLSAGGVWISYQLKPEILHFSHYHLYLNQIKSWMKTSQTQLQQGMESVKKLASTNLEENPPIEFEFYQTLPAMDVGEMIKDQNELETKSSAKQQSAKIKSPAPSIFNEEQIQRDFNDELENNKRAIHDL